MCLEKYLRDHDLTAPRFAEWMTRVTGKRITPGRVYSWLRGTMPRPEIIKLIVDLTHGEVRHSDWFPSGEK